MNKLKIAIALIFLQYFCNIITAQLNFTMGYSSVFYRNESLKKVVNTFNDFNKDTLNSPFKTPYYLHGLEMGVRYKWENVAIQGGFSLRLNTNKALFKQANDGTLSQKVITNYNAWFIGATGYVNKWLGLGTSFDFTTTRIKNKLQTDKNSTVYLDQTGTSSQVFLVFDLPANKVLSLSIKPFFQWPWNTTDYTGLQKSLNGKTEDLNSKWWTAGVTFLFCNGVQNNN